MRSMLQRFLAEEDGLEMAEWALASVLIVIAAAGTFQAMVPRVHAVWDLLFVTVDNLP